VNRESPHPRTYLHQMISLRGLQIGDNRTGKIRIEEKVLTEHLARTHADLIETGAEFGFGHGISHKPLELLTPATIRRKFFLFLPKLFTWRRSDLLQVISTEGCTAIRANNQRMNHRPSISSDVLRS
jgi:hypothetical protein